MALSTNSKVGWVALTRFGYGSRGDGDIEVASRDPRSFLKAELMQPGLSLLSGADLPSTSATLQMLFAEQAQKRAEKQQLEQEPAAKTAISSRRRTCVPW